MIAPRMLGTSEAKVNAIFDLPNPKRPLPFQHFCGLMGFFTGFMETKIYKSR
jgi:hypothetical protein